MSIAKANFLEPYSPSFGGWARFRQLPEGASVTAELTSD